ncbi:MAG TPA: hypothetical protein VHC18_14240 [Amycolatopsis sp.]|nr:hypothetical protein [Amycolatopsis sp.]
MIALGLAVLCIFDADIASAAVASVLVEGNSASNTLALTFQLDAGGYTIGPQSPFIGDGCTPTTYYAQVPAGSIPSGHYRQVAVKFWSGAPGSLPAAMTVLGSGTGNFTNYSSTASFVRNTGCTASVDIEWVDLCVADANDASATAGGSPGVCGAGSTLIAHWIRLRTQTAPPSCVMPALAASYVDGELAVVVTLQTGGTYPVGGWRVDNPALVADGDGNIVLPPTARLVISSSDAVPGRAVYYAAAPLASLTGSTVTVSALDGSGDATCWAQVPVSTSVAVTPGTGTDQGGDGSADCGFSWNPLHDFQCALHWAFYPGTSVADEVSGVKDDFVATGPGSVTVAGVGFFHTLVTLLNGYAWDNGCANVGVTCLSEPTDADGHPLGFLDAIPDLPGYSYMRDAADFAILGSAMLGCWHIARRHLGAQT